MEIVQRGVFGDEEPLGVVGQEVGRRDSVANVTGRTTYVEDLSFPGMLHVRMVRSPHHHARITSVDLEPAKQVKGFARALTHEDVPENWYNLLSLLGVSPNDEPVLAEGTVRYRGEPIVAILADTPESAADAAGRVKVTYEELPAVFDVEEALAPRAPVITTHGKNYWEYEGHHCRRIRFGDVEKAFGEADRIIEGRYDNAPIEHAPVETNGCIAVPDADGRITVHSNTQALFFSLANVSLTTGIPPHKLRFMGGVVGGGFGGKVDVIVERIATLAAKLTGRPVKFFFTREEEMRASSTRGAWRFYIKDGVMNDGKIIARKVTSYLDSGAYTRLTNYGVTKSAAHQPGPYAIPNVWVDGHCVFTNRTPASAMRGFGVTMTDFALESQMDHVAATLGMDPMELRLINAYRDGDITAHRKEVEGAALVETIQAAARLIGKQLPERFATMSSLRREG